MAATSSKNFIISIASIYLVVSAIRDLYDKSRGTKNISTWFTSVMQFILAFFLFMFART
jgi:hypothetical protein